MRGGWTLALSALALVCWTGAGGAAEEATPGSALDVRVGLAASVFRDTPEPLVQAVMRPFRSIVESQTGLAGQLVPGVPAEEMSEQLRSGKLHFGVFLGHEFAWAREENPELRALMIAINQNRILRAQVVVRDDRPAASFDDLKGLSLAIPRRTREHCHLFVERRCQARGASSREFFGRIVTPPTMEEALDAVLHGECQAAVVDDVFLAWYRDRKPRAAARLKVVERSESFPATVVAYHNKMVPEDTLRRFREGMLAAKDNPRNSTIMKLCQISAFEPVPDDYERLLAEILKAYPAVRRTSQRSEP